MEVVDRRQHFAEKLDALTRTYGDRPSSRVRDLPDLMLLIEDGLDADDVLVTRVRYVFGIRGTHPVPDRIPDAGLERGEMQDVDEYDLVWWRSPSQLPSGPTSSTGLSPVWAS